MVPVGVGLVPVGVGAGRVTFGVGKVPVSVGVGKVPVCVGKVPVGVGKVPVCVGKVPVPVGVGKVPVPVGVGPVLVPVPVGVGPVPVPVPVPVGVGPVPDAVGPVPVVQEGTMMVSSSRVTAPLRASARPVMVSPVCTVIEVRARMVPWKVEPVPIVAELPTCQKTLQAWAPLVRRIVVPVSVPRVERGLEYEDRVRVALRVQGQRTADVQRGGGVVYTGREGVAGADEAADGSRFDSPGGIVVARWSSRPGRPPRRRRPCAMAPFTVPGGNPVTAVPGLTPRSPLMTLGPVLVTVVPARTA